MTRVRATIGVLLVLVTCFAGLQPVISAAADCSAQKAAVDQLGKDISRLNDDLAKQRSDEAAAIRDIAQDLKYIDDAQQALQAEAPLVRQELESKGLWNAAKALGVQLALTAVIIAAGPEGWGVVGHTVATVAEIAERAHTAVEVADLLQEGAEAGAVMDELASGIGDVEATRKYADENDLSELNKMLDLEEELAGYMKRFDRDWQKLKFAANAIKGDEALLAKFAQQLQDALAAYWACLDKPGPVPSDCEGQPTNPNGVGVCR